MYKIEQYYPHNEEYYRGQDRYIVLDPDGFDVCGEHFPLEDAQRIADEYNTTIVVIQDTESKQYLSLLGSAHFTDNKEIAQRFVSTLEATEFIEEKIDSLHGFNTFGMIDCEAVIIEL